MEKWWEASSTNREHGAIDVVPAAARTQEAAAFLQAHGAAGQAVAPERVEPSYLRDNVALTLEQQQQALRAARG